MLLRRSGARLVHANGVKAALVCALAARGTRLPVLWHKHDSARDGRAGRWIARRCDLVAGVSSAVLASLAGTRGVRAAVVPNGIPAYAIERSRARATLESLLDARSAGRPVALVGRLHPGKGQLRAGRRSRPSCAGG